MPPANIKYPNFLGIFLNLKIIDPENPQNFKDQKTCGIFFPHFFNFYLEKNGIIFNTYYVGFS